MLPIIGIFIIVIILIILSAPVTLKCLSGKEGFRSLYGYYKQYCPSCGSRGRYACSKCVNCGWCFRRGGHSGCVPGDSSGPYFAQDCVYWSYADPKWYNPFNRFFPSIQYRDFYPFYSYRQPPAKKIEHK